MKTRILIVEDEAIVALQIKKALIKLNFEVSNMVSTYEDVFNCITDNEPDIIMMDINLEGSPKDGIEIVHEIQKIRNIPVVYLTGFGDDETIERAIVTNPVGYLLKPFKPQELKSTILLGLYKINHPNDVTIYKNCLHIGFEYYFDLKNKSLYFRNKPIRLSVKEKELISILVEAKGAIVTFTQIEHMLWPDKPVSNSALRTLVYRLRSKLDYKIIETVPSFGCKLTPTF